MPRNRVPLPIAVVDEVKKVEKSYSCGSLVVLLLDGLGLLGLLSSSGSLLLRGLALLGRRLVVNVLVRLLGALLRRALGRLGA